MAVSEDSLPTLKILLIGSSNVGKSARKDHRLSPSLPWVPSTRR